MRLYANLLRATLTASLMLVAIEGATSAEPCLAADEKGEYSATEAVQCLRQEAVQGNDLAQYLLGSDYHAGCCDLPQNYAEALKWYRRAADQGNSGAQFVLGGMHAKGEGVPTDFVRAHMWFNLAAAQGTSHAAEFRDAVAQRMTPAQIAEAQRLAREW
jgi:TPR repeat protein